jgi:intein/homing endonuclease
MKGKFRDLLADVRRQLLTERLTFDQLVGFSDPKRITRSQTVKVPPLHFDAYKDAEIYYFNVKSAPSTTGLRHKGMIKCYKPKDPNTPLEKCECEIDCTCFAPETLVLMADGRYKPIADIRPGDSVYTHKGRVRRVLGNVGRPPRKGEKVYILRVKGVSCPIVTTENHPFLTLRDKKLKFIPVKDLKRHEQLVCLRPSRKKIALDSVRLQTLVSRKKARQPELVYDLCIDEDHSFIVHGVVVANCPDYRYRWAWANKQRGSGRVGAQSFNQAWNKAPRITNPVGRPGACIAKGERVATARGLIPVEEVVSGDKVWTLDGWHLVTAAVKTGVRETVKVVLRSGRSLVVTKEHKIYAFHPLLGFDWIEASSLICDEHHLCVAPPSGTFGSEDVLQVEATVSGRTGHVYTAREILLGPTFAELTGYMVAEGAALGLFCNTNLTLLEDFCNKWQQLFGDGSAAINFRVVIDGELKDGVVNIGNHGMRILEKTGYKTGSANKVVPEWIFRSTPETMVAFLRGCYAGDGNFCGRQSTYATISTTLGLGIHRLLTHLGVTASLDAYHAGINHSLTWFIRTTNFEETQKLYNLLNPIRGYSTPPDGRGASGLHEHVVRDSRRLLNNVIQRHARITDDTTLVAIKEIHEASRDHIVRALSRSGKEIYQMRLRKHGKPDNAARLCDIKEVLFPLEVSRFIATLDIPKISEAYHHRRLLIPAITALKERYPEAYDELQTLIRDDVSFDEVVGVVSGPVCDVYDLTVDNAEHFTVNGVVVHNCKHVLALRDWIYGKLRSFAAERPYDSTTARLDKLVQQSARRWANMPAELAKAKERDARIRQGILQRSQAQAAKAKEPPSPDRSSTTPATAIRPTPAVRASVPATRAARPEVPRLPVESAVVSGMMNLVEEVDHLITQATGAPVVAADRKGGKDEVADETLTMLREIRDLVRHLAKDDLPPDFAAREGEEEQEKKIEPGIPADAVKAREET